VKIWLVQCLLTFLCLTSLSVSSCVDLAFLYDSFVPLLFNYCREGYNFYESAGKLPGMCLKECSESSFLHHY
jgi:hypothetical protein